MKFFAAYEQAKQTGATALTFEGEVYTIEGIDSDDLQFETSELLRDGWEVAAVPGVEVTAEMLAAAWDRAARGMTSVGSSATSKLFARLRTELLNR